MAKQQYIRTEYADGSVVLSNVRDSNTDETYSLQEVTEWHDGTPMTDGKADGYVYRKLDNTYFKRVYSGYINFDWFAPDKTGTTPCSDLLNLALTIGDVEMQPGTYKISSIVVPANKKLVAVGRVDLVAETPAVGMISIGTNAELKNFYINGEIEQGVSYAGSGVTVRSNSTGTVVIDNVHIKNIEGTDLSTGNGNCFTLSSGYYFTSMTNCSTSYHRSRFPAPNDYPNASRGIYVSSRGGGIINNCTFEFPGELEGVVTPDDPQLYRDTDAIIFYTDRDDDDPTTWANSLFTFSNNLINNFRYRGVKLQADNVKVSGNKIFADWDRPNSATPFTGIDNFGTNNSITDNLIDVGKAICISTTGGEVLIEGNNLIKDKDALYPSETRPAMLIDWSTSAELGQDQVPKNVQIRNNNIDSLYSVTMSAGSNIIVSGNKLGGRVTIQGSRLTDNISIQNNEVFIPERFGRTWAFYISPQPDSNFGNITITGNVIGRCSRLLDILGSGGLANARILFIENFIKKEPVAQSPARNLNPSLPLNNFIVRNDDSYNPIVLPLSTSSFDLNPTEGNYGYVVKGEGGGNNITNAPGVGYWTVWDKKVSGTDHVQFAVRTNSNGQGNIDTLTANVVYYRVYSEVGTSTGWTSWIRLMTRADLVAEQVLTPLVPPSVTVASGAVYPYSSVTLVGDIIINPQIQNGTHTVKVTNNLGTSHSVQIQNGFFPDGTNSVIVEAGSVVLIQIDAIAYSNDRRCFARKDYALKSMLQLGAVTAVTEPNATDEATAIALANANKAKINEIIAKLSTIIFK